jgi:hypothetical protein
MLALQDYNPVLRGSRPVYRNRYTDYATGWTVHGSSPGMGKIFRNLLYQL